MKQPKINEEKISDIYSDEFFNVMVEIRDNLIEIGVEADQALLQIEQEKQRRRLLGEDI